MMIVDVDRLARALDEFYGKRPGTMAFAAEHIAALYEGRPARQIVSATNPPRIVTEGGSAASSEDAAYTARSDADRRKAETITPTLAGRSGVARA